MDNFDTDIYHSAGIIILSNVKVTATAWWGDSTGWVLNNSSIASCQTENASINKGASENLHPKGNYFDGKYNYENPAPAIIGSGASWYCYETLDDDFKNVDSTTKNRVFLLKDSTMTEDADLSVSGVTMDFSECTLTTGTNSFSVSNSGDGQNILRNGKIIGDLTLTSGDGGVALSNLTVTGTIKNKAHPMGIGAGYYNDIETETGKVSISGGYYSGTLTGDSYEISGGYFVNEPSAALLKEGYTAIPCTKTVNGVTYNYFPGIRHHEGFHRPGCRRCRQY